MFRLRELATKHPEVDEILPKDQDLTTLRRFCEDFIETRFERVKGVSNSNVVGGREEEMQVIVEPELLATALDANQAAREVWDCFPPSARKFMLWWVISAAKVETQQQRIAEIVAKAALGERARTG